MTVAVPCLPTEMPAVALASTAASGRLAPAPSATAKRGDQRVAGAGDVGDLARPGRQVQRLHLPPHQRQAFGGPGDEHRLAAGLVQRHAAGAIGFRIVIGLDPRGDPHLKLVRRQDVGTAIGREVRRASGRR